MPRHPLTFHAGGLPHFADRLALLYLALPEEYRGTFYAKGRAMKRASQLGVTEIRTKAMRPDDKHVVIVAGHEDYRRVNPADVIMVAHGVGQTYGGVDHASYSGGKNRDRVVLNLCAGEYDAKKCRESGQPSIAIGPFHIDRYLRQVGWGEIGADAVSDIMRHIHAIKKKEGLRKPVIAFSSHCDVHVCEETRWSFPHYQDEVARITRAYRDEYDFIGHCHPRIWSWFKDFYRRSDIEYVPNFTDVLDRADLYISDNSCVSPDTPILCADLSWRPARDIHPGMDVIACDEERTVPWRDTVRESRRFRTASVLANQRKLLPSYLVRTTHGDLQVSERHPWLVRENVVHRYLVRNRKGEKVQPHSSQHRHWGWKETRNLNVGDEVAFLAQPWLFDEGYEAGWLAGILDGEGCLDSRHLSVSQNEGVVLDRIREVFSKRGLGFTDQITSQRPNCHKLTVHGHLAQKLKLLGSVRPIRLLAKAQQRRFWESFKVNTQVEKAEVLSVEYFGLQEVCVMQTTEKTFVAGGFIAHNSTLYEFAATGRPVLCLNGPQYRRDVHHGLRFWDAVPGLQVDEPHELFDGIKLALDDPQCLGDIRDHAVSVAYGDLADGHGLERAVTALMEYLDAR